MDPKFAYLLYSLVFIAVWLALFAGRADLRQPMLIYSILIAPLGPASEAWYLRDYWKPQTITGTAIGLEDALFSFAIGGITLALYPVVSRTLLFKSERSSPNPLVIGIFAALLFVALFIGTVWLGVNSVIMSALAFLATAAVIVALRRDLLVTALASGIFSLALFVIVYQVMQIFYPNLLLLWCTGCNPSGITLLGINIEEYFWDASWGVLGGTLYPSVAGLAYGRMSPSLSTQKSIAGS